METAKCSRFAYKWGCQLPVDCNSNKVQNRRSAAENVARSPHVAQLRSQDPASANLKHNMGLFQHRVLTYISASLYNGWK